MSEHLLIERRGHVMEITLNKPKVNAIDHEMSKAVADAFVAFDKDDDLRVAILTAAGDRIFSAGWDLKALDRGDAKLDEWWDDGDYGYGEVWGSYLDLCQVDSEFLLFLLELYWQPQLELWEQQLLLWD